MNNPLVNLPCICSELCRCSRNDRMAIKLMTRRTVQPKAIELRKLVRLKSVVLWAAGFNLVAVLEYVYKLQTSVHALREHRDGWLRDICRHAATYDHLTILEWVHGYASSREMDLRAIFTGISDVANENRDVRILQWLLDRGFFLSDVSTATERAKTVKAVEWALSRLRIPASWLKSTFAVFFEMNDLEALRVFTGAYAPHQVGASETQVRQVAALLRAHADEQSTKRQSDVSSLSLSPSMCVVLTQR